MVLVGTAGVWLVSRGWAEETHEVQAKDDEVTKNDNIDYNDEEIVEPETLTIAEGNITVISRTFLPPNEWTFKSFGTTHVDIHEDVPPDGQPDIECMTYEVSFMLKPSPKMTARG